MLKWLTDEVEKRAWKLIDEIEAQGGVIKCIENGWFQRQIADSAYRYQRSLENKSRLLVGVNCFREEEEVKVPIFRIDPRIEQSQVERIRHLRATRDSRAVEQRLEELKQAAQSRKNLVPYVVECVRASATLGEIVSSLKDVFGEYTEPKIY